MQITPASLDAIFYGFDITWREAYARVKPWWDKIAYKAPSAAREQHYGWMRLMPRMRQWVGERKYLNLESAGYILKNLDFEMTVEVDRNDLEDDQYSVYTQFVQTMGEQAARWPDDLICTLLIQGQTQLAFDGQAFFSTSHPTGVPGGSSTYSNYSASGLPLSAANLQTIRQTMMLYVGEDGKPLLINPSLLVVPPQLEIQARQILQTTYIAPAGAFGQNASGAMQENPLNGVMDLLVVPELGLNSAVQYFVLDVSKPIKPFVFQERKSPTMVPLTDPTSEPVFKRRKFVWGLDSRGNAGYSLPFLAYAASA